MVCMGMVLFTGSRVALVLLISGILMLLYFNNKGSLKGKIKGILLSIILLFLFYFLLFEVPYFYQIAGHRVENIVTFFHGGKINEGSIVMRSFMIQFGINLFKENPFIGYGINNYRILLGKEIGWMTYAHNNYIELLVDLGMIGVIAYYSIHTSIILSLLKLKSKPSLKYLFLSFLLVILIIDFASINYYDKNILIVLAMSSIFVNLQFLESNHEL